MNIRINPDELNAVDQYLHQASRDQLQQQLRYATYSRQELILVFPAIRKLLDFGASQNKTLPPQAIRHNYAAMHQAGQDNPRYTFMLVLTHTQVLKELLAAYRLAWRASRRQAANSRFIEQKQKRDWLFSLAIADMSEAQYRQFRQLIGG